MKENRADEIVPILKGQVDMPEDLPRAIKMLLQKAMNTEQSHVSKHR